MLTKALFDSPKAKPLRGRFRLLLHGFQSHYFRPQPLDLVGGFAHRGPGVQVNRNALGLLTQPLHYAFKLISMQVRPFDEAVARRRGRIRHPTAENTVASR